MEGSHIVSYGKKVCCVFRRCNQAVSDYKKNQFTNEESADIHEFIQLFIHSLIRLTNFVIAIHGFTVKREDKFPTIATQPVLQTLTATDTLYFRKYQGV
jgi:hypothetical protein